MSCASTGAVRSLKESLALEFAAAQSLLPSAIKTRVFDGGGIYMCCFQQAYSEFRKKFRDKNIDEPLLIALIEKYKAFQPDPDWNYLAGLAPALMCRDVVVTSARMRYALALAAANYAKGETRCRGWRAQVWNRWMEGCTRG